MRNLESTEVARRLSVCAAVASMFVCVTAFAAVPVTPVIPVLSSPAGTASPGNSAIAVDGQGNFAVAWDSDLSQGKPVYFRLFTADGTPLGDQAVVDPNDFGNIRNNYSNPVALTRNTVGQTAIAWDGAGSNPQGGDTILVRTYQPDGSPLSGTVAVSTIKNNAANLVLTEPGIAMTAPDEFVVAWGFNEFKPLAAPNIGTNKSTIYMRRFKIDGTPLGAETVVTSEQLPTPGTFFSYIVRVLPNPVTHGFAISYFERAKLIDGGLDETAGNDGMHFKTFSADGSSTSGQLTLPTGLDGSSLIDNDDYGLSYLPSGDLALAYAVPNKLRGSTLDTIYTRRYSPTGVPRGAPVAVGTRGKRKNGRRVTLNVAVFSSGAYAVSWADNPQNLTFARYIGTDGQLAGDAFPIGSGASVNTAANADGSLATSYGAVFARIFSGP